MIIFTIFFIKIWAQINTILVVVGSKYITVSSPTLNNKTNFTNSILFSYNSDLFGKDCQIRKIISKSINQFWEILKFGIPEIETHTSILIVRHADHCQWSITVIEEDLLNTLCTKQWESGVSGSSFESLLYIPMIQKWNKRKYHSYYDTVVIQH